MRGRIQDTSKDGNLSESVNDSDPEETTEEEEDGEDTDDSQENAPQLTHTATELTDAVSYMSKAELDKLRGVSESVKKNPTTTKSKKAEIKAEEEEEVEEEEEEDETGFTCPYEHVTYLSAADLQLLRDADPDLKMLKNGKDKKLKRHVRESEDDDEDDGDEDDGEGANDGDGVGDPASMSNSPYLTQERAGEGEGEGGEERGGEREEQVSLKINSVSRSKRAGKRSRRDSLNHINLDIHRRRSSSATEAAHAHAHDGEEHSGGLCFSAHHAGDVHSHEGQEVDEDEEEDEEEEDEDEEDEELHMKREKDLDFQYEESDDKLWANIPPGQKSPFPPLPFPSIHLFLDSVSSFFPSSPSFTFLSFHFFFL